MQWGAWAGAGMAGNDAQTRMRVELTGLGLVESRHGLAALEGLLHAAGVSGPALLAAVPVNWPRFLERQFAGAAPPMFSNYAAGTPTVHSSRLPAAAGASSGSVGGAAAAGSSPADREAYMLVQVQEAVRSVLGSAVSSEQPLMAAGLDSLSSVELRNSLEGSLGVSLPSTLVFDYPTMAAMAGFLATKIQPEEAGLAADNNFTSDFHSMDVAAMGTEVAQASVPRAGVVSISDMVVRTPEAAFTDILPKDAVGLIPATRWDLEARSDLFGGLPLRFGTFLDSIDQFDAQAMGVSDGEAMLMDPQQRLLLELVGELLMGPAGLAASKPTTSVFVGLSSTDYAKVGLMKGTGEHQFQFLMSFPPRTCRSLGSMSPVSAHTPPPAARSVWLPAASATPLACGARR